MTGVCGSLVVTFATRADIWMEISASCTPGKSETPPQEKNGTCAGPKPGHEEGVGGGV